MTQVNNDLVNEKNELKAKLGRADRALLDVKKYIHQGKYREALDVIEASLTTVVVVPAGTLDPLPDILPGKFESMDPQHLCDSCNVNCRLALASGIITACPGYDMKSSTQAAEDSIRNYLTEILTQDCRSTAKLFFYVIRYQEWILTAPGEGDRVAYWSAHYEAEFNSNQEFRDHMIADEDLDDAEYEDIAADLVKNDLQAVFKEDNMFLTESDANDHLKANAHHYPKDAKVYLKHAGRAPAMYEFFGALMSRYDVIGEGSDLCRSCDRKCTTYSLKHCSYKKGEN